MKRSIFTLITALWCLAGTACAQETNLTRNASATLSATEVALWREDLDVLSTTLEQRHIHLFHSVTEAQWRSELAHLKARLPELNQAQVIVELMRLTKLVGDGHTQANYWGDEHSRFPLGFQMFDEDIRIIATDQAHRRILGWQLEAINQVDIAPLKAYLLPVLLGVENRFSERQRLVEVLPVAEVLHGLAVTSSFGSASFQLRSDQGDIEVVSLHALPAEQADAALTETISPPLPPAFKHRGGTDGISLYLHHPLSAAYLDFRGYPSRSNMDRFVRDLRNTLEEAQVRSVAIDLRNNGGGDFFVGLQLAWGLVMIDHLDWRDGIYVLTGGRTFSAAMSNAVQYRQILNATLVGEPTGANPVGYQDAGTFTLPNSKRTVMHAKRFYRFQADPTDGVQPDMLIPLIWEEYRSGKDSQLEWILADIERRRKTAVSQQAAEERFSPFD